MQPRAGAAVSQKTPAGEATWGVAPGRSQARGGERSGTDNQRPASTPAHRGHLATARTRPAALCCKSFKMRHPARLHNPASPETRSRANITVEEDFSFSKDCFALDQCQARLYTAIARHAVLVMAALAICAITAAQVKDRTDTQAPPPVRPGQPPPPEPGMIPLTIPEIKRLLAALTARPLPRRLVIHWDAWTRRHQARSRWFHKRARLARQPEFAQVKL
jgi:hypothetical protein